MKRNTLMSLLSWLVIHCGCLRMAFGQVGCDIVASSDGVYSMDAARSIVWRIGPDKTLSNLATGIHDDQQARGSGGHLYASNLNQALCNIAPNGKASLVGGIDDVIAVDANGIG